jgi:hypothetical protein
VAVGKAVEARRLCSSQRVATALALDRARKFLREGGGFMDSGSWDIANPSKRG